MGRRPMRGGRKSRETIGMDGKIRPRLNLTQKLLRAGVIDPARMAGFAEETC